MEASAGFLSSRRKLATPTLKLRLLKPPFYSGDIVLVSDLWAHDAAQGAIRANMVERAKAQSILTAMQVTS